MFKWISKLCKKVARKAEMKKIAAAIDPDDGGYKKAHTDRELRCDRAASPWFEFHTDGGSITYHGADRFPGLSTEVQTEGIVTRVIADKYVVSPPRNFNKNLIKQIHTHHRTCKHCGQTIPLDKTHVPFIAP